MRLFLAIVLGVLFVGSATAQDVSTPAKPVITEVAAGDSFHASMVKALKSAADSKQITKRQSRRLRIKLLSPAFRAEVKELAVTQMAFSDDADWLPRSADGKVQVGDIDWSEIISFLEKLIPLIERLISLFGV